MASAACGKDLHMTYVSETTADISDQQLLAHDYLDNYAEHSTE
jgi:hypothetical protein